MTEDISDETVSQTNNFYREIFAYIKELWKLLSVKIWPMMLGFLFFMVSISSSTILSIFSTPITHILSPHTKTFIIASNLYESLDIEFHIFMILLLLSVLYISVTAIYNIETKDGDKSLINYLLIFIQFVVLFGFCFIIYVGVELFKGTVLFLQNKLNIPNKHSKIGHFMPSAVFFISHYLIIILIFSIVALQIGMIYIAKKKSIRL